MHQRFLFYLLNCEKYSQIKAEIEEIHVVSAKNILFYLSSYIKIAIKMTFLEFYLFSSSKFYFFQLFRSKNTHCLILVLIHRYI